MDNRNYFTMAIPALLLGVAYLQPINAAPAEDLPNVTGRMTITQQTFTVSGVVTDTNGEPIIGANVIEKGTTNGAVTDFDGKFSLSLQNKQSILVVTYIGYNTKEIPAGNGSPLTIQLQDDTQNLDEVIVVGYSVQKKKDLTGAVSVLEVGDLKDTPVSSVDQMMQGKLSGVNVIPDNMPGGGVAVRVRGFSTIRNNDPLYIIDGVPVEGGINFLNPNDIESMQVLKDASSTAIYGTRGGDVAPHPWGVSTRKGDRLFIHVLDLKDNTLYIPLKAKVKKAMQFTDKASLSFKQDKDGILLKLPKVPDDIDYVIELIIK